MQLQQALIKTCQKQQLYSVSFFWFPTHTETASAKNLKLKSSLVKGNMILAKKDVICVKHWLGMKGCNVLAVIIS